MSRVGDDVITFSVRGDFYHPPTQEDRIRWAEAGAGRDEREAAHALYLAPVGALHITLTRYPVTGRHRKVRP